MMGNIFFYKRIIKGKDGKEDIQYDCINLDCVVRGVMSGKTLVLLLNDGHEQAEDVTKPVYKNGKPVGTESKRERAWYHSQAILEGEDIIRFAVKVDPSMVEIMKDLIFPVLVENTEPMRAV